MFSHCRALGQQWGVVDGRQRAVRDVTMRAQRGLIGVGGPRVLPLAHSPPCPSQLMVGLQQAAVAGTCPGRTSCFSFCTMNAEARARWDAWRKVGAMDQVVARDLFVQVRAVTVAAVDFGWHHRHSVRRVACITRWAPWRGALWRGAPWRGALGCSRAAAARVRCGM